MTLFVSSALHHALDRGSRVNDVLRTLDYDSVFLLIAGSVTPLVLVLFRSTHGWAVLGAVWLIAASGVVLCSLLRQLPKYVTNTVCSAGLVVFVIGRPNPWPGVFGVHEIWHVMVVVAAGRSTSRQAA